MTGPLTRSLFSLRVRLVLAMAGVVFIAILATGTVFVYRSHGKERAADLQRIASATTSFSISTMAFNAGEPMTPTIVPLPVAKYEAITQGAPQDFRIIVVNREGVVVSDPKGELNGEEVFDAALQTATSAKGVVTWQAGRSLKTGGVTFVAPAAAFALEGKPVGLTAVAAVDSSSLTSDWLDAVPGLMFSALLGVPLSLVAALIITSQITNPLRRLAGAADAMSRGDFDQEVVVRGHDEVAALAASFTVMARRVKERDAQLRGLIGDVSHDLRTPMTSIQGYAEAIVDGTASEEAAVHAASIIRDEAVHASAVLADLLCLTEIDAGEVVIRSEVVDLETLISRCLRRFEGRARAKDIALTRGAAADAIAIADPEKLERVLTNLLDNAVKFAPTSGQVSVRVEPGQAENVAIVVANNGPAIAEDEADLLFDRFYRVRREAGCGLGLAIALELTRLMGGNLVLRQREDPVEFALSLPS